MSTDKKREFTKVDRALEMTVIDWLQWTEWEETIGKKHPAELALEMISLRKASNEALQKENQRLKEQVDKANEVIGEVAVNLSFNPTTSETLKDTKKTISEYLEELTSE